ncbi:hypothetical protein ACQKCH_09305 [Nubsella zeaxanthinifaciens]|uniref:hypothetical protein n=1 Tax=Nubsella zeaxanthinifaciens TaxID=392412 RepID=UPI003CFD4C96
MIRKVAENPLAGELGRADIRDMVKHYRKPSTYPKLKYSHFRLEEILQVFSKNKVLPQNVIDAINHPDSQQHIANYGVKIYIGRHKNGNTLPEVNNNGKYLNKGTTILVNTDLHKKTGDKKGFKDMLDEKLLIIGGEGIDEDGVGLDRAEIEPPYHVEDGRNYYDVGEE